MEPDKKIPAEQGIGYKNPPAEHRFQPGRSGNPAGRARNAGSTVVEWINAFAADDLLEADLREISNDRAEGWARRAAANRMIRCLETGDIADFVSLLSGKVTLDELRHAGVKTDVIKRFKRRIIPTSGGRIECAEIELHDRSGADFDRICDRTNGRPRQTVHIDAEVSGAMVVDDDFSLTDEQIRRIIDMAADMRAASQPTEAPNPEKESIAGTAKQ